MSAKLDRSKLKGTSLKAIKVQNSEMSNNSDRKKREYLSIDEGTNKFRILPSHPDTSEDNQYSQRKFACWLPFFKKDDNGNLTNKQSKRPFLNARVHAGQEKDIIEQFILVATKLFQSDSSLTTSEKSDKIKSLSDFKTGIKHQSKFVCYAVKLGDQPERGILEISNGIKKKLDDISLAEFDEDPEGDDIISDPETGVIITIKYDKAKPNAEKYSVNQGRKASPISDEDLDWWFEEDSITEILHTSVQYDQGTVDRALDGLKIYDEENDLNVFDSDEFQSVAKELKSILPESQSSDFGDDSSSSSESPSKPKTKKTLGEMSKEELKAWVLEEDLDIRIMRKDSVEEVLEKIEAETGLTEDQFPATFGDDSPKKEDEEEVFEKEDDTEVESEGEDTEEESTSRRSRRSRRSRED